MPEILSKNKRGYHYLIVNADPDFSISSAPGAILPLTGVMRLISQKMDLAKKLGKVKIRGGGLHFIPHNEMGFR